MLLQNGSHPPSLACFLASLGAGAIAGPLGWISCFSIEVTRIHWQANPGKWPSVWHCVVDVYRSCGGLGAFFRGLPVACVRSSLQISVTMALFEKLRSQQCNSEI